MPYDMTLDSQIYLILRNFGITTPAIDHPFDSARHYEIRSRNNVLRLAEVRRGSNGVIFVHYNNGMVYKSSTIDDKGYEREIFLDGPWTEIVSAHAYTMATSVSSS